MLQELMRGLMCLVSQGGCLDKSPIRNKVLIVWFTKTEFAAPHETTYRQLCRVTLEYRSELSRDGQFNDCKERIGQIHIAEV